MPKVINPRLSDCFTYFGSLAGKLNSELNRFARIDVWTEFACKLTFLCWVAELGTILDDTRSGSSNASICSQFAAGLKTLAYVG